MSQNCHKCDNGQLATTAYTSYISNFIAYFEEKQNNTQDGYN